MTQFYKVAVDYDEPFYNVVGGTQDNSTQHGPSRTDNLHGIRNSDWMLTVGGDGHQSAIDPTNPNIIYSESQQGNLIRHDRKTGEIVSIKPQPADGEENDRFNWDSIILISPHDQGGLSARRFSVPKHLRAVPNSAARIIGCAHQWAFRGRTRGYNAEGESPM